MTLMRKKRRDHSLRPPRKKARGSAPRSSLLAGGKKFGIVVSRFNEFITKRLLDGAMKTLVRYGANPKDIQTAWVPGALEAPFFAQKMARRGGFDALIVLGCVLRGETIHFENVSHEVTRGVSQAALETGVPIANGIIMADHMDQALDRAQLKGENKGEQAALAAIEIANLNKILS